MCDVLMMRVLSDVRFSMRFFKKSNHSKVPFFKGKIVPNYPIILLLLLEKKILLSLCRLFQQLKVKGIFTHRILEFQNTYRINILFLQVDLYERARNATL